MPPKVQLHLVASGIFTDIPCVCKPTARIDAALENGNNVAVASPVCQASSFSNLVNGACGSASPVPTTDNAAVSSHTNTPSTSRRTAPTPSRRPVIPLISPVLRPSSHAPSQKGNPIKDPGRLKFELFAHHQHHPVIQASRRGEVRQRHGWSTRQEEERWSCRGLAASSISPADPSSVDQLALVDHDDPVPLASNRHVHIASQPTNFNLRAKEQASQWVFVRLASGWPAMIMSRHVHEVGWWICHAKGSIVNVRTHHAAVFGQCTASPIASLHLDLQRLQRKYGILQHVDDMSGLSRVHARPGNHRGREGFRLQFDSGSSGLPLPHDSLDLTQNLPLADLSDPHCDPYFPMFNAPSPCYEYWVRDNIFGVRYAVFGFDIQSAGRLGDEEQEQKSANGDSTPNRPSLAWLPKMLVHSLAV
ncbi:hypothetical protein CCHR01_02545 [Colletotrichum chrysophilum]|uniref:Uncharacterized protein n=1 Tax=Colletotrichum chrysophilum TaxID=1836956 RepID=A0AAD9ENA5_9PEZI|nr:hypothetical protein CCHR01_02545 [Colletotrichum chrysophilum]